MIIKSPKQSTVRAKRYAYDNLRSQQIYHLHLSHNTENCEHIKTCVSKSTHIHPSGVTYHPRGECLIVATIHFSLYLFSCEEWKSLKKGSHAYKKRITVMLTVIFYFIWMANINKCTIFNCYIWNNNKRHCNIEEQKKIFSHWIPLKTILFVHFSLRFLFRYDIKMEKLLPSGGKIK